MTGGKYVAWKSDAILIACAIIVALLGSSSAQAQSIADHTGGASTITTVAPGGVWTNPSNAATLDDTWASVSFTTSADIVRPLVAGGFTWGVPDISCLVKGVTVRAYVRGTGDAAFASVRMASGTTAYGSLFGANQPIVGEGWAEFDGPEETWSFGEMTWEDWSAAFTGCRMAFKSLSGAATVEVDHIEIVIHVLGDKTPATAITDSGWWLHKHVPWYGGSPAKRQIDFNRMKLRPTMLQPVSERIVGSDGGLPLVVFEPAGAMIEGSAAYDLLPHYYGNQQRGSDTTLARFRTLEVPQITNATSGINADTGIGYTGTHFSFFLTPNGSSPSSRMVPGFYLNGLPPMSGAPAGGTIGSPWANLGEGIEDSTDPECYIVASSTRQWKKHGNGSYTPWFNPSPPSYYRWARYELIQNTEGDGGGGSATPGTPTEPTYTPYAVPDQTAIKTKLDPIYGPQTYMPEGIPHVEYNPTDGPGVPGGGGTLPTHPTPDSWTFNIPLASWTVPGALTFPNQTVTIGFSGLSTFLAVIKAFVIGWVLLSRISVVLEEFRRQ